MREDTVVEGRRGQRAPERWVERTVLHVDMDAFFASVEVLDRPELAGRPVVVGGSGLRGVVASCTYEARAFGVRSAMPSVRARQLCPDAVFLDGRYWRYADVSEQLQVVLAELTPLVEPIGLDEAFLDVTGARRLFGSGRAIADRLRVTVRERLSLDCSIGVGRSKLVAKLASRAAKPVADRRGTRPGRRVVVVAPEEELAFLHPQAVEMLWGVGPATGGRLHELGVRTVGQLAALPEDALIRHLGRAHGRHLAALARAEDPSPVVPDRRAKSIGHERTFPEDIEQLEALVRHATDSAQVVAAQLRAAGVAGRTVTVKVRFADFSTVTRSHTLDVPVDTGPAVARLAVALLEASPPDRPVRLLGVSVGGLLSADEPEQLAFELETERASPPEEADAGAGATRLQRSWHHVEAAVEAVRGRFGGQAVGTANRLGGEGPLPPDRRAARWGPSSGTVT